MAEYQHASDSHGTPPQAYSGVIQTATQQWVACMANSKMWDDYLAWVEGGGVTDPWKSLADGGVELKLLEGQEAVGSMRDSMYEPEGAQPRPEGAGGTGQPPARGPGETPPGSAPERPARPPASQLPAGTTTTTRTTTRTHDPS